MTERATDENLAEWKSLADAATEGPWQCRDAPEAPFDGVFRVLGQDRPMPSGVTWQKDNRPVPAECRRFNDALFVSAARTAVPSLIAEIERLREAVRHALNDGRLNGTHTEDVLRAALPEKPANGR